MALNTMRVWCTMFLLQNLEKAYRAQGWKVKIFTDVAISNKDGNATFYHDNTVSTSRASLHYHLLAFGFFSGRCCSLPF